MKHVFILNSHTTFLTVCGTISFLGLQQKDIVLLCVRNYKTIFFDPQYKIIDISKLNNDCYPQFYESYKSRKVAIRLIDDFISVNISEPYVLYIPHLASSLFQTMYTNPLCKSAAYIQEGAIPQKDAFLTKVPFKFRIEHILKDHIYRRTKRIWRYWYWYIDGFMYKQKALESFAINNFFFKYLPSHNNIVKWPSFNVGIEIKDNACIFVFDGYVSNDIIDNSYYMVICERLINTHASLYNYIKFHPGQSKNECDQIIGYFRKSNFEYELIDNDIPLEIIIASMSNLTFVGFSSSLLYFAKQFGHNVISEDKWLIQSPKYCEYKNKYGVKFFEENVKEIQDYDYVRNSKENF